MARKTKVKPEASDTVEPVKNNLPEKLEEKKIFDQEGELVVDVFETKTEFVVLTAIAGVQIKDLDIAVEKGMMVIKGQRENPHNLPSSRYFYQECHWGPFSKKIVLPEDVNVEAAKAEMNKGILTIKIPKAQEV